MGKFNDGGRRDSDDPSTDASTVDSALSRRRLLGATTAAVVAGLAGCTEAAQESFEATPVVLPGAAQQEFVLAETARDAETTTRDGPGGTRVAITNHASVNQRGVARGTPTILEKVTSRVNGTEGAGAATLHLPNPNRPNGEATQGRDSGFGYTTQVRDSGVDIAGMAVGDGSQLTVSGDQIGLILPTGAKSTGDLPFSPEETVMMARPVPAADRDQEEITYEGDGPGLFSELVYPPNLVYPPQLYPGSITGDEPNTIEKTNPHYLFVPEVEALMDSAGIDESPGEMGELVEPGQTVGTDGSGGTYAIPEEIGIVDPGGLYIAGSPDTIVLDHPIDVFEFATDIYDRGISLYGGTSTFGLGALATPDASVSEESANPIVAMETEELLQEEAARRMIARSGLSDADTVEWLAGPESVDVGDVGIQPPQVFPADIEEFGGWIGVVDSDNGPVGILAVIARGTDDDHVIATSVVRRAVATPDGGMAELRENMVISPGYRALTDEDLSGIPQAAMSRLERL